MFVLCLPAGAGSVRHVFRIASIDFKVCYPAAFIVRQRRSVFPLMKNTGRRPAPPVSFPPVRGSLPIRPYPAPFQARRQMRGTVL
jgi:hypothetical protein